MKVTSFSLLLDRDFLENDVKTITIQPEIKFQEPPPEGAHRSPALLVTYGAGEWGGDENGIFTFLSYFHAQMNILIRFADLELVGTSF